MTVKLQPTTEGAALPPLTAKHTLFIDNFFACGMNISAAARRTGYNWREGYRLMRREDIQAHVQQRMTEYMSGDEVMQRLTALARTTGDQFLTEQEYQVPIYEPRPLREQIDAAHHRINQWLAIDPEKLKAQIDNEWSKIADWEGQLAIDPDATYERQVGTETRVRIVPSLEAAAENGVLFAVESAEYTQHGLKFKRQDPVRALELIGKHHKLFADRTEVTGPNGAPIEIIRRIVDGDSE